jgi:hypothetical protein
VVAVSYFVMEEGETMGTVEYNEYTVIGDDEFSKHLIGAQPGVMLDTQFCVAVEEDGIAFVRNYANVVVEYIVKDNSIQTVADMDTVFISYEVSFDVEEYRNTTYGGYDIPENFASDFDYEIIDGKLTARVDCAPMVIYADAEDTPIRERSFTDHLIGAVPGNIIPSITVYDDVVGQVEYTDIQIHSIVNQAPSSPITFKYTPYLAGEVDHLEATVKNIYGTEINILDTELTYAIYPVNYLDVEEFTARFILFNFYGTVLLSTHDENLNAVYNLNLLNDGGYKCVPDESAWCDEADVGKTLLELTTELRELGIEYHKKYDTMNEALTYLKVVQGNYANYAGISEMERHELEVKLANAKTAYVAVRVEKELAEVKMNTKIAAILCCKKGDLTVEDAIVSYCRDYIASGGATFVTYPHLNLIPTE